jgi:hypothetical protein
MHTVPGWEHGPRCLAQYQLTQQNRLGDLPNLF